MFGQISTNPSESHWIPGPHIKYAILSSVVVLPVWLIYRLRDRRAKSRKPRAVTARLRRDDRNNSAIVTLPVIQSLELSEACGVRPGLPLLA